MAEHTKILTVPVGVLSLKIESLDTVTMDVLDLQTIVVLEDAVNFDVEVTSHKWDDF